MLPPGLLSDGLAAGMARAYHNKTNKVVLAPSGKRVVVCTAGEIDQTHYIDSNSGQGFSIDHLTLVLNQILLFFFLTISLLSNKYRQHLSLMHPQLMRMN